MKETDLLSTILLLVKNKENEELLSKFLSNYYKLIIPSTEEPGKSLEGDFDLCVLDVFFLTNLSQILSARKLKNKSEYLPYLLISSKSDLKFSTPQLGKTIDEIIIAPVEKVELHTRIQVLLQMRKLNRQLDEVNKHLTVTLDSIGEGVISTNSRGIVNRLNPVARTILGRTQNECIGKKLVDIFPLEML